jgi:hypothetical protein
VDFVSSAGTTSNDFAGHVEDTVGSDTVVVRKYLGDSAISSDLGVDSRTSCLGGAEHNFGFLSAGNYLQPTNLLFNSVISLPFAEVGLLTTSIVVSLGRVIGSMAVLVAILVDLVQARIYAEKILHHFNRIFAVKKSSLNVINLKVLDLSIGKNSPWQYL